MAIELTTWERIMLVQILGGLRGDLNLIRRALPVLAVVDLSESEREEIGLIQTPDGVLRWSDESRTWPIEIDNAGLQFLRDHIQTCKEWPANAAAQVVALAEKLGI